MKMTPAVGSVEKYLLKEIDSKGAIHFTLIDPEKLSPKFAAKIALEAEKAGSSAILIGGSTITPPHDTDLMIKMIKREVKIPIILFPGNVTGINRFADAILFTSLLNSSDPYFLTGAQALGAPLVKKYGLEPISSGYIVVGYGGAVSIIGHARPIPYDKPELVAIYALAAQYMGMHFVYLEAGSGADSPIPPKVISHVRKTIDIPLIVGGGIRSGDDAMRAVKAGANILVTGTIVEQSGKIREKISEIVNSIKK
jgi:phosphoglycerol geranylgeranyltransferase